MGHARALAGVDNIALQLKIYKEAIDQQLSVRSLESLIKSYATPKATTTASNATTSGITLEIQKIKEQISHQLGTKVDIKRASSGKGSITILFNSDKEFNNITQILAKDN